MTLVNFSSRTIQISDQAQVILEHRYFLKDSDNKVIEDPNGLFRRVAKAIAKIELDYGKLPVAATLEENDFFVMMSKLEFIPNSPTLMNAGP